MTHKKIVSLALGTILSIGVAAARVPDTPDVAATPAARTHGRHHFNPERQVQFLGKKLNLTDDQKSQMLPIFTDQNQQMRSILADTSLSRQDRRQKMSALHQDSQAKIAALLTDDQKQKYADLQQQMKDHGRARRRHYQGSNANTEPPDAAPQNN